MTLDQNVQSFSSDMAAAATQAVRERKYWLKQLSGNPEKTCFPYDYDKPNLGGRKMDTVTFRLPDKLYLKLIWISNESDFRLFMLLVSGLVLLLNKYTDNDDIIVGTPIYKQDIEGDFINTVLALRTRVQENMTFKEFLYQMKQVITEAIEHQNYPLRALLHELNLSHSEENFPLFDIPVIFENIQEKKYIQHIHTNMNFSFQKTGEYLEGTIEFNQRLYRKDTVQRIGHHFAGLLDTAFANVDLKLSAIDLLSQEERKKLLEVFCGHPEEYAPTVGDWTGKRVHQLFEEQMEKTPDNIALVFDDKALTYRAFDEKANRLARRLRKKGGGSEIIIAILMESSMEMAAAVMAVLKAGAVYLSIDLEIPDERKKYILEDSAVHLLLTDNNVETGSAFISPGIEMINACGEDVRGEDRTKLDPISDPSDLAYIIYTSGSTGRPRGVMVEHRQAVNTLVCRREEYKMDAAVTVLQLFSYAFDGFVTSFFTPVISGARIVLLSKQSIEDISCIINSMVKNRVTHFISIPVLYRVIMNTVSQKEASLLQVVTLAGDKVLPDILELTAARNKNIEIVNEYGITEAAVWSTIYRHQERDMEIKIGRPIRNTAVYISRAGDHYRLMPVGLWGEMCIAGAGVTRGYLNKPDLTQRKFVENPFDNCRRMLKTGDLSRWLSDGNIEFSGRKDFQVKIRGFRIELGEIERRLLNHKDIKESVVVVNESDNRDKYLCAYITSDREVLPAELREYLSAYLPAYMVPTYFLQIAEIPLTPNGKIDRKVLPKPNLGSSIEEYVPPRDEIEKKLVRIWSETLGIEGEKIGIENDFFECGGHSLSLVTMISHIQNEFGIQIPVTQIFEKPVIKEIANYIKSERYVESPMMLLNLETQKKLFCFPPGVGYGIAYKGLSSVITDYSFYSFNFIEEEDRLNQYVELITNTQPTGPYILFGYSAAGALMLEVTSELENRGFKVSDIIMVDSTWKDKKGELPESAMNEFMGGFEVQLKSMGMEFLMERLREKVDKYLKHIHDLTHLEVVHANVHLIMSEEARKRDNPDAWNRFTSKTVTVYEAVGTHIEVFSEDNLGNNAALLKEILDKAEFKNRINYESAGSLKKVLFIPNAEGVIPHTIPLLALEAKLNKRDYETAFLLPGEYHGMARALDLNILDVSHGRGAGEFQTEIIAYKKFKPDVVVDDASISTFFVLQTSKRPRVAVQRTGVFPGGKPRKENHKHSMGSYFPLEQIQFFKKLGMMVPQKFGDLFAGDMKIVPGIRSIEVLPELCKDDPTYVFSGPLIMDDMLLEKINNVSKDISGQVGVFYPKALDAFLNNNKDCVIVYFTFGNIAEASEPIFEAIRYLLDSGVGVITSIHVKELSKTQEELYLFSPFLPMHYVCSNVDLMIHHCGSGTYQYPILHEIPSITIGTRFYDRDDVAMRLEELGVSKHIPSPSECNDFVSLFKETLGMFLEQNGPVFLNAKQKLKELKAETDKVAREFDFTRVLEKAVEIFSP